MLLTQTVSELGSKIKDNSAIGIYYDENWFKK